VIRTETCVEAAVRLAVGLIVVGLGHLGGTFVASLFPGIGLLFYAISVLPLGVAGLYAVATGLWVVVEGATGQALERHAASMAVASQNEATADDESEPAADATDGVEPTDDNS
jgi:hypothetical protein